jgi:hypothetical protein
MPSCVLMVRCAAILGLFAGVAFVCVGPAPAQPAKTTIDDIVRAWEERQGKVKSVRAELAVKEMLYKGYVNLMRELSGREGLGEKKEDKTPNPPRDYEVEGIATWVLDGDKLRYTRDMPVWGPKTRALHQEHYESLFDRKLLRTLRSPAADDSRYPFAIVKPATQPDEATMISLMPLTITFRGHHELFIKDLRLFEVSGRVAPIRGKSCLELVYQSHTFNRRELMYVDPARGYVVTRKQTIVKDTPTWQLDVSYDPDPVAGWMPREWEYMIRIGSPPIPYESGKSRVTSYTLNGPVSDGEFAPTYSPGTRVTDSSEGKEVQFVVREDGEAGPKIPLSQNPTYDDLRRAAESPPGWWRGWRLAVLLAGAVLIVVVMVVWVRRRRRPGAPAPDVP